MQELKDFENKAYAELNKHFHNHNIKLDWEFSKTRHGCYNHRTKTITLNMYDFIYKKDTLWNTLLHELAHAIDFNSRITIDRPHGIGFKYACQQLGIKSNRTSDYSLDKKVHKYIAECKCNNDDKYHYMNRTAKRKYRCRSCKERLIFIENKTGD